MPSILGLLEMVKNYPGANFFSKLKSGRPVKAVQTFVSTYSNPALMWEDLKFLKNVTKPSYPSERNFARR